MKTNRILITLAAAAVTLGAGVLRPSSDEVAVERAVADYVESLYEVRPELVERSVHPDLAKRGFVLREGAYHEVTMTYDQLLALAAQWNAGGRVDPERAVKEIVVFDVLDQTASAKLVASWGVDYLQLAKYDGQWKIVNVLWQVPPRLQNGE